MLGLVSKLVPYGRLIKYGLIVAVIAGIGLYVWHLRSANATLRAKNATQAVTISSLQAANKQNVAALAQIKSQYALAEGALQTEMAAHAATQSSGQHVREAVRTAHGGGAAAPPAIQAALGPIR